MAMVWLDVSAGGWEERLEKTHDALAGPPVFIPPQILGRARTSHLHPSGKGRSGVCLRWLGPLVIATWFVTLALGRGAVS